jgi:transcriptional regulator GlxA family with amidase domain
LAAEASKYHARALARACRVTLRHLERFFLAAKGATPQKWLDRLRLRRATALLDGRKGVKEVAWELGYKQASHFSRAFKQFYGVPPKDARMACSSADVAVGYGKSLPGTSPCSPRLLPARYD